VTFVNKKHRIFPKWALWMRHLVPQLQCSPRENFRPKTHTLKGSVWLVFSINIYCCIIGMTFKSKNNYFISRNCVYKVSKNFQILCQKYKWALWMRQLVLAILLIGKLNWFGYFEIIVACPNCLESNWCVTEWLQYIAFYHVGPATPKDFNQ
jgi:hypothetical protein